MSDYMYWAEDISESIEHHGTLGQKWGVRRYQYEDGSLTPEGRRRYLVGSTGTNAARDSYLSRIRNAQAKDRRRLQERDKREAQARDAYASSYNKAVDRYGTKGNDAAKAISNTKYGSDLANQKRSHDALQKVGKFDNEYLHDQYVKRREKELADRKEAQEVINSRASSMMGGRQTINTAKSLQDFYGLFRDAGDALGIETDSNYENLMETLGVSEKRSGARRSASGKVGELHKPGTSKEYRDDPRTNDYNWKSSTDSSTPHNYEGYMISNDQLTVNPDGTATLTGDINNEDIVGKDRKRNWQIQKTVDKYGNTKINVIDKDYNIATDNRSTIKKALDAYGSGWNTIKDTYVSGLKTIGSWFKW